LRENECFKYHNVYKYFLSSVWSNYLERGLKNMVNKRIVLGILLIAFVGIAAAGTWANFVVSATDSGTLKAGTIAIRLDQPFSSGFSMDKLIPDSTVDPIKKVYHSCGGHGSDGVEIPYKVTVKNTGDLPASLFISDVLTSTPADSTIKDNVVIYYSTTPSGDKVPITSTSTDTTKNVAAVNGAQDIYLWYSYTNIANNVLQTAEMGDTVNAVITYELKNPDTSAVGDDIN
jgi:hypothetical protein